MTEDQYNSFLYSCKKMANKLHFNNEDGIVNFLGDKTLDEQTFYEVIAKNTRLLKALNSGVCFTMSSWVFDLLRSLGLDNDYYFMESANAKWANFVILYKSPKGFKICDLAAQASENEEIISELTDISISRSNYSEQYFLERTTTLVNELSSSKYLSMNIEDYIKEYPLALCKVLMHHGYEECIYTEVPRKSLLDFIKDEVAKVQSSGIKK